MLRAVITLNGFESLTASKAVVYVGPEFPDMPVSESIALAEVTRSEQTENWKSGFYQLEGNLGNVEEGLRAVTHVQRCAAPPPNHHRQANTGSALIRWLTVES